MSNIVIRVGSMRKGGNTDLLARRFAEGAALHNSVEIIAVADYKVAPCIGFNTCFNRESHACFHHDDMEVIYGKLLREDILVIPSPVFFYGISAKLKAIIDRLHTPMRNSFAIRKLALLLVGAASLPNLFDPILMQYQMILDFFHLQNCGKVLVSSVKDMGDIIGHPALDEAYRLGASIE